MQSEPPAPKADGARRHQHELAAVLLELGDRARDRLEMSSVEAARGVGHNSGAKFDDCAPRRPQSLLLFSFQGTIL